ncbi:MAG: YihY/virulence factor BrkB family protein [Acidobacteria bacterium]|nr:YihY/virulence factor BrkB family protein [Acidobacteriota bacterium]
MTFRRFLFLVNRAVVGAFNDNCFEIAKSAAYSSVLSFFPGLMVVASLLFRQSVVTKAVMDEIADALGRVLPPESYRLAAQYLTVQGARTVGLLTGAWLVAIWSASNVMLSLVEGFRVAYRIPTTRSLVRARLVGLALLALSGVPLLAATLLLFFGQQIENWLLANLREVSDLVRFAGKAVRWVLSLGTSGFVIGLLYYVGPNRPQRWRFVWPGAVLATVLWLPATLLFAWYVKNVARYRDLYGSISTAVVLLIWMYLVNLIVMVGCEFNAEYERLHTEVEKRRERSGL